MTLYRSLLSNNEPYCNNDTNIPSTQMRFLSNSNEYFINSLYGNDYKQKTLSQRCTNEMKEIPCVSARIKLNEYLDKQYLMQQERKNKENKEVHTEADLFYKEWLTKQHNCIDECKIREIIDKKNSVGNEIDFNNDKWCKRIEDNQLQSIEIEKSVLDRMCKVDPYCSEYIDNVNRNEERLFNKDMFKRVIYNNNTNNIIGYDIKENQNIIDKVNCKLQENVRKKRVLFGKFDDTTEKLKQEYNNEMLYHHETLKDMTTDNGNNHNQNDSQDNLHCLNNTTPLLNCFQFRRKKDRKAYTIK